MKDIKPITLRASSPALQAAHTSWALGEDSDGQPCYALVLQNRKGKVVGVAAHSLEQWSEIFATLRMHSSGRAN